MISDIINLRWITLLIYMFISVVLDVTLQKKYLMKKTAFLEKRIIDFISYMISVLLYKDGPVLFSFIALGLALINKLIISLIYVKFESSKPTRMCASIGVSGLVLGASYLAKLHCSLDTLLA